MDTELTVKHQYHICCIQDKNTIVVGSHNSGCLKSIKISDGATVWKSMKIEALKHTFCLCYDNAGKIFISQQKHGHLVLVDAHTGEFIHDISTDQNCFQNMFWIDAKPQLNVLYHRVIPDDSRIITFNVLDKLETCRTMHC